MPRVTRRRPRSHHRPGVDPLGAAVGRRIRLLRKSKGFAFDAFVGETELGRGYVSEIERGLSVPTLATLGLIARVLEVELIDLFAFGNTVREELVEATREVSPAHVRKLLTELSREGVDEVE